MDLFDQIDSIIVNAQSQRSYSSKVAATRIMIAISDNLDRVTWETTVAEGEGSYHGAADWIRTRIK